MRRRKEKFVEITPPPRREPWIEIEGYLHHGYTVIVHKENDAYWESDYKKTFRWGYGRAERWGKRMLQRYLARRDHEDFRKVIH